MHLSWIVMIVCLTGCYLHPLDREPMCTSRFDFEKKLLNKVIRMEIMMEAMNTRIDGNLQKFGKDHDAFTLEFDNIRKEMGQTITDMKASYGDLEDKADVKLSEMGGILDTNVAEMKQNIESSIKSDVMFNVKDINGQPAANSIIKFTTVMKNTNNVYNLNTGCFTATMKGTYWFSAQLCTIGGHQMSPSLYVQNTLVNRQYIYDSSSGTCGSVATVAVIHINDTVCLKAGPHDSSSPVWSDNNYNTNSFMGALLN